MKKLNLFSLFALSISQNAYAHGMSLEFFAILVFILFLPGLAMLVVLVVAVVKKANKKDPRKYYRAALMLFVFQIIWAGLLLGQTTL